MTDSYARVQVDGRDRPNAASITRMVPDRAGRPDTFERNVVMAKSMRGGRDPATPASSSPYELSLPASSDATDLFKTGPTSDGPQPALQNLFVAANKRMNAADGAFYGGPKNPDAGGVVYRRGTPLEQIKGIAPAKGKTNDDTIVLINGMYLRPDRAFTEAQEYANRSGSEVVGIYNATNGKIGDFTQIAFDKLGWSANPAIKTAGDLIYDRITSGKEIHVMGRSQGAIILQRALDDTKTRLEKTYNPEEVTKLLGKVKAETVAGASTHFPDGPKYVHYLNDKDQIVTNFGLLSGGATGGRDARYIRFSDTGPGWPGEEPNAGSSHKYGVYSSRYRPFDEAYRTGATSP